MEPNTPIQPPPPPPLPAETPSKGKGMILLGGLVLVVVMGAMLYYIVSPKSYSPTSYKVQTTVTPPPQQVVQVTEEQELEQIDTGDPSLDLEDLEKDLANL